MQRNQAVDHPMRPGQTDRRLVGVVFFVLLVVALLAAGGWTAAAQDKPIRIAATNTALLVWIAKDKAFFRAEGLDVQVELHQSGSFAADRVLDGAADLSTTSESAVVARSFTRSDVRILATISASETARLVGRRDRGIATAGDLVGKRIGVTLASTGEFLLGRYLTVAGLRYDEVELIDLKPAEIAAALVKGDIDAGLTWEPYIHEAEIGLDGQAVKLPGQEGQHFYFTLMTTEGWVERNRQEAVKLMRALVRAEIFAIENADAAKAIIARTFEVDRAYLDHLWPLHNLHVNLSQDLLFALEQNAKWRIASGFVGRAKAPNYLDHIAAGPLREVSEMVVGIVE